MKRLYILCGVIAVTACGNNDSVSVASHDDILQKASDQVLTKQYFLANPGDAKVVYAECEKIPNTKYGLKIGSCENAEQVVKGN